MKNAVTYYLLLSLSMLLFSNTLSGQDLTYRAKNPAFGGNYLNYSWLQSSAQIQDTTVDPDRVETSFGTQRNELDDFTRSLNRSLLSRLSRQLLSDQFGEEGLQEGNYIIGDYEIDVLPTQEGISITIVDAVNGGETQIVVPHF